VIAVVTEMKRYEKCHDRQSQLELLYQLIIKLPLLTRSVQGKTQKAGTLQFINEFLNQTFLHTSFTVKETTFLNFLINKGESICNLLQNDAAMPVANRKVKTLNQCQPINENKGYWYQSKFKSYSLLNQTKRTIEIKNKLDTLIVYGDSLGVRFFGSIQNTLCRSLFTQCRNVYLWVYIKGKYNTDHEEVNLFDNKDFNQDYFINDIKDSFQKLPTNRSVMLINFGLHYVMSFELKKCKELFLIFIKLVTTLKLEKGNNFPLIIWKTTTPPQLEQLHYFSIISRKMVFITKQRVEAWNTFTKQEACKAGIPVLDVYDMALSYPPGSDDLVHYKNDAFSSAENALSDFILKYFF